MFNTYFQLPGQKTVVPPTPNPHGLPFHGAQSPSYQDIPPRCARCLPGQLGRKIWQVVLQPQIFLGFFWAFTGKIVCFKWSMTGGQISQTEDDHHSKHSLLHISLTWNNEFFRGMISPKNPTVSWVGSVQDGEPLGLQGASKSGHLMCENWRKAGNIFHPMGKEPLMVQW